MTNIDIPIINEELLKLYSPLTLNADITDFYPYILLAQELYIKPIIGEALLIELKEQIKENDLTEDNSALIIKIAPVLALYTCYQGLPFLWARLEAKGLTVKSSENSESIEMKDLNQLRLFLKNDAEAFQLTLIEFLCKCKSSYPLWQPDNESCCNQFEKNEFGSASPKFDSGIFFKNKPNNCGCGC